MVHSLWRLFYSCSFRTSLLPLIAKENMAWLIIITTSIHTILSCTLTYESILQSCIVTPSTWNSIILLLFFFSNLWGREWSHSFHCLREILLLKGNRALLYNPLGFEHALLWNTDIEWSWLVVTNVFKWSLSIGYIPQLWINVRVLFIPEPGKGLMN